MLILSPSVHLWDDMYPQTNEIMNKTDAPIQIDTSVRAHLSSNVLPPLEMHVPGMPQAQAAQAQGDKPAVDTTQGTEYTASHRCESTDTVVPNATCCQMWRWFLVGVIKLA
jgi:hypothetical protein